MKTNQITYTMTAMLAAFAGGVTSTLADTHDHAPAREPWMVSHASRLAVFAEQQAEAKAHDEGKVAQAVRGLSMWSRSPEARAQRLMASLEQSVNCYDPDAPIEAIGRDITVYALRNPAEGPVGTPGQNFLSAGTSWLGSVSVGVSATISSGSARKATLTYSFPDDGPTWGTSTSGFPTGPNALNAKIDTLFTLANRDRGRELFRQALASWRHFGGIVYTEVDDDNSNFSSSTIKSATRGDIRIGGIPLTPGTSVLAYNQFASSGGDMTVNLNYFNAGSNFGNPNNNYRYWRNVAAHEHGHGLGYQHVVGCNQTKLMEPQISTAFDMVQIDERRGAGRNYGDRFSGNSSVGSAKNFGDLTSPVLHSVIEKDLSTNGSAGALNSNQDWFKFTLSSTQDVTITATPTGGSYNNDSQTSGCNAPAVPTVVNANQAGNLNLTLWNANGTSQIVVGAAGGAGTVESVATTLAPGTYAVQVIDIGPNANQTVQLYDLGIQVGTAKALPEAIAGVNKRIQAGQLCFFDGTNNSRANEPGSTISSYSWDLDDNGTFEVASSGSPTKTYFSNGVFDVTLRVTDSNAMTATDTIQVTVYGATTVVNLVSPTSADVDTAVPVAILGMNLKGVTSASQVVVSGTGVTVTGTPVPDSMGVRIDGLTFHVAAGATPGARDVTINNSDGQGATGTGLSKFTVNAPVLLGGCQPADIADDTGAPLPSAGDNTGVNEGDYNAFFQGFFDAASYCDIADDAGNSPPTDTNTGVNEGDYNAFFQFFFQGCP